RGLVGSLHFLETLPDKLDGVVDRVSQKLRVSGGGGRFQVVELGLKLCFMGVSARNKGAGEALHGRGGRGELSIQLRKVPGEAVPVVAQLAAERGLNVQVFMRGDNLASPLCQAAKVLFEILGISRVQFGN